MFPPMEKDLLMYLCLMGGQRFHPFENYEFEPEPFREALLDAVKDETPMFKDFSSNLSMENRSLLEDLVTGAIVLASHRDGFAGIAFGQFLSCLLFELGAITLLNPSIWVEFPCPNVTIPYLAKVDMEWPGFLLEMPLNIGKLTRNSTGQIRICPNVSIQFIHTKDTLENILQHIPDDAAVHFVISASNVISDDVSVEDLRALMMLHHAYVFDFNIFSKHVDAIEDHERDSQRTNTWSEGNMRWVFFLEL
ncbi:hypothetical protein GN244_ATG14217 [Phytophthora infestans]|uniref:Uncharacterized protein n=1 Tax=Phytophthora infestans TaxID=4787 RepID=A0A833S5W2_PHYIN|nr:hypothetical protein GN244_ATG14217 [Phytophthora infestans]KAF4132506.1 hypothetical protein GN958_ATG18307 [Phytophthora infestans]KAF4135220.1 hypothetical protein GN958_ATG15582 [Phytophthora infestans]